MQTSFISIDTQYSREALSLVRESAKTITDVINSELATAMAIGDLEYTAQHVKDMVSSQWPELQLRIGITVEDEPLAIDDEALGVRVLYENRSLLIVQVLPSPFGEYMNHMSKKLQ